MNQAMNLRRIINPLVRLRRQNSLAHRLSLINLSGTGDFPENYLIQPMATIA